MGLEVIGLFIRIVISCICYFFEGGLNLMEGDGIWAKGGLGGWERVWDKGSIFSCATFD